MVSQTRLFVGNLPENTNEDDLKSAFSSFGEVLNLDLKTKSGDEINKKNFAFVMISGSNHSIESYHYKANLNLSTFRLLSEFIDTNVLKLKSLYVWLNALISGTTVSNRKNIFVLDSPFIEEGYRLLFTTENVSFLQENLMWMKSQAKSIKHFCNQNFNGNRLYVSRARESFLERLERERQEAKQQKTHELKQHAPKTNPIIKLSEKLNPRKRRISDHNKINGALLHKVEGKSKSDGSFAGDTNVLMPNKKKEDSDKKRIESLKKKRDEFKHKQMIIKSGLIGIDKVPNRKTKFSDSEDESDFSKPSKTKTNETFKNLPEKKTELFDNDADSDGEVNFEIKKQFEGKKGQKVLDLQSRYKSDKRFVLDERFIEDQSDEEDNQTQSLNEHEQIETGEADEKLKQLNILQDVLGVPIKTRANSEANSSKVKKTKLGMLRFDPTQPEHAKFLMPVEVTNEPLKKSKKKKNKEKQEEPQPEDPIIEQPKIDVSKEQFYKVSETLKEAIAQPNTFSFRSLFGQNDDNNSKDFVKDEEVNYIPLTTPTEKKVKNPLEPGQKNPFVYDSSDSESESEPKKKRKHVADTRESLDQGEENPVMESISIKPEISKAVWRENFFFTETDNRLKDGLAFFNMIGDNEIHKERRELKSLMKKRIYNKQRKNQMFQKKIGGRKKVMKKPYNKRRL